MAEILDGHSDHLAFAPLSTEQTRAIAKHLQNQLNELGAKLDHLERESNLTNGFVQNFHNDLQREEGRLDALKQSQDATQLELEVAKKDIQQGKLNQSKLRSEVEQANVNLGNLRDSQHKTAQLAQNTATGLEHTNDQVGQMRNMLENKVNVDIEKLRDELLRTDHNVKQLNDNQEIIKNEAKQQLEHLRSTHAMSRGVGDSLAKTDSALEKLTQRVQDLTKNLVATQKHSEGTRTGVMKLQDNTVRVGSAVADLQIGHKKMSEDMKFNRDSIDRAVNHLGTTQGQLDKSCIDLRHTMDSLSHAESLLQKLKSGVEMVAAKNNQVSAQLEQTDMLARETKKGLHQTNSIVLPNLQMDTHVASNSDLPAGRSSRTAFPKTQALGKTTPRGSSMGATGSMLLGKV
mmetsp:Transcript_118655/g.236351  ORF Transcript_118655/g.236351 Transcript_118655/m.236351 type:complete len:403 (-) Transcript_118655:228-1436(-)